MSCGNGSSTDGRLLARLERVFWAALLVLLTLTVAAQAMLSTESGRRRVSRTDRLEGMALRVVTWAR